MTASMVTFLVVVTFPASPHAVAAAYTLAPYWMFSVKENPRPTTKAKYTATRGFLAGANHPNAGFVTAARLYRSFDA